MTDSQRAQRRHEPRYLDGAELKRRREAAGMTQAALADVSGTTQNRLAHWEIADEGGPGIEAIAALAGALRCEMRDLMHEEGVKAFTRLAEAIQRAPGAATAA